MVIYTSQTHAACIGHLAGMLQTPILNVNKNNFYIALFLS